MPKICEQLLGGHCINICGYSWKSEGILSEIGKDIKSYIGDVNYNGLYFIVRNSWGKTFGDKAYMYMPAKFLQKYSSDWWHIDIK